MSVGPTAIPDQALPIPPLRLDHELVRDLLRALASPAIVAFLLLQVTAAVLFVVRRGPATLQTILLVWTGLAFVGFICWWAGRHRLAHAEPDPVPMARARLVAGLTVAAGLAIGTYGISSGASGLVTLAGIVAWLVLAIRAGSGPDLARMLRRSWRPFGPLLILVVVPRVALTGLVAPAGLVAGLGSGVVQELLYLPLLFASLEAVLGRRDVAAVVAALVFASIHVPMNLGPAGGDWLAAAANAVFCQAAVGLIVAMAFSRHRAALPLGIAHGLTIA
ncbi:MAG: hypothetical protein U0869_12330 [Chloroflexota bacterium]